MGAGGVAGGSGTGWVVADDDGAGLPQAAATTTSRVSPEPTSHRLPLRPVVIGLTLTAAFEPLSWAGLRW